MTVRCKFKCSQKIETESGYEVGFAPVTSGSAENESFFNHTPYGGLTIGTINPDAAKGLNVGEEYFIDISPAA